MLAAVAPLVETFRVNQWLFERTFENISEGDLLVRPNNKGNSIQFILGHVTSSRFVLANMLGVADRNPWGKIFRRGAVAGDASQYPSVEEIRRVFGSLSDRLITRLSELEEADIRVKAPDRYPVSDDTILGAITFLSLHESFHMGQCSYVRKLLGHDGLAG